MKIKSLTAVDNYFGKTVLVRVDFNVPMRGKTVREDYKIAANLPLINYLLDRRAKVLLITHLGEPQFNAKGSIKNKAQFSTKPLAMHLSRLLKKRVVFLESPIGSVKLKHQLSAVKPGQVVLLENIRFYEGEKDNSVAFAKQLAALADIYVNNAFAVSHRKQASVSAIKRYLPSYAGQLLESEVVNLSRVLRPTKPLVAVLGGAKIDSKLPVIKNLLKKADYLLVGGGLANSFLAARGLPVGLSLVGQSGIKAAKKLNSRKIILPVDVLVGDKALTKFRVCGVDQVKAREIIYDIGPETMKLFAKYLKSAKTMVWNGPLGKFEEARCRQGTMFIGRSLALYSKGKAFGLVGGGETVEALRATGMMEDVDWVSTGGGAALSFLAGEKLPGLDKLIK